jgi:hypothetical protein
MNSPRSFSQSAANNVIIEIGGDDEIIEIADDDEETRSQLTGHSQDTATVGSSSSEKQQQQQQQPVVVDKNDNSKAARDQASVDYDNSVLRRAVEDAGRWAYGTVLVELWALNEDRTFLFCPPAGWWIDPVFQTSKCSCRRHDGDNTTSSSSIRKTTTTTASRSCCQICSLTDASRSDHVPPAPVSSGVGLPGVLWAETANRRHQTMTDNKVVWREIKAIANDPDQPWNPRLQTLASLGLGWAAAVGFDLHGHSGIVLYMAREGVDLHRLQTESNEVYLLAASNLAAAAYALRGPRRRVVDQRRSELADILQRAKSKITALKRVGVDLKEFLEENAAAAAAADAAGKEGKLQYLAAASWFGENAAKKLKHQLVSTIRKTRGGGVQPPPAMGWQQSLYTFAGAFVTLAVIASINNSVVENHGTEYGMVLA